MPVYVLTHGPFPFRAIFPYQRGTVLWRQDKEDFEIPSDRIHHTS